jgi:putative spermidine/putrescine transport system permease protein
MRFRLGGNWCLSLSTLAVLLFLHFPVWIIVLYSFTTEQASFQFPPPGLTTRWYDLAINDPLNKPMLEALERSINVALISTGMAIVFGTLAALGMYRARFLGRDIITLMIILPIALPGIVTALSLRAAIVKYDVTPGLQTVVIGHATFCIVTVYNNVVARLRRTSHTQVEASLDLGASPLTTFWHIILPQIGTALLAGGLLAFALSFDEVIVTRFTYAPGEETLPIWILNQLTRPRNRPITNVSAVLVIAVTIIPILLAHRLTSVRE